VLPSSSVFPSTRRLIALTAPAIAALAFGCARTPLLDPPSSSDAAVPSAPKSDARDLGGARDADARDAPTAGADAVDAAPPPADAPRDVRAGDVGTDAARDARPDAAADTRPDADARDAVDSGCTPTLASPITYAIGPWARNIVVADVDGDGKLDFVFNDIPERNANSISVLTNLGARSFSSEVSFPARGAEIEGLAVADLDGDGQRDVVACEHQSSTVGVYLNAGGGKLGPRVDTAAGGGADGGLVSFPAGLLATDLDGDHRPDLVVGEQDLVEKSGGGIGVLMNKGDGTWRPVVTYPNTVIDGQMGGTYERGPLALAVADLDGDGSNDVVTANTDAYVAAYLNNGDGTFAPESRYRIGAPGPNGTSTAVAIGDLDGDGDPDLAVLDTWGPAVACLLNNGHGGFAAERSLVPAPHLTDDAYTYVAIGDIDGDGMNDIVTSSVHGDAPGVSVFFNRGGATFAPPVTFAGEPNGFIESLALADVDGDGRLDVVLITDGTFHVEVFYGTCAARAPD
jgi:hypothetical protein